MRRTACVGQIQDHPRRCGEHRQAVRRTFRETGSSPQMRGAHSRPLTNPGEGGIIPADAGSTRAILPEHALAEDHPRRCGEHSTLPVIERGCAGSSPQMRGARPRPGRSAHAWRIIPADAGSTRYLNAMADILEDHPRRCGEHSPYFSAALFASGSSPQMRGARLPVKDRDNTLGIIPADAGSTTMFPTFQSWLQDHSRRCGEHT